MSPRASIVVLFVATACVTAGHDPNAQPVSSKDCYTCHQADYAGATKPVHTEAANPSAQCADCHSVVAWIPGGRHPENNFPIQHGAHSGIDCATCHNTDLGSSVKGANTDCVACHTRGRADDDHSDVSDYGWEKLYPGFATHNFCLACHPTGRAGN